MRLHRLTVSTLVALLASCIGDVPAQSTTRVTSADTSAQSPALMKVDPADPDAKAARFEEGAARRELDRERKGWMDIERTRREREAAFSSVWTRIETADVALVRMKSRLARTTAAEAAERGELDARIAKAETARTNVEHQVRSAQARSGWPALRGEVDAAVTAFEKAVLDPP